MTTNNRLKKRLLVSLVLLLLFLVLLLCWKQFMPFAKVYCLKEAQPLEDLYCTYDEQGNLTFYNLKGKKFYRFYNDAGDLQMSKTYTSEDILSTQTNYTYDQNGKLITKEYISDTTSSTTSYTYDDRGNLIFQSDSSGSSVSYTYNDNHVLIQKTTVLSSGGKDVETYRDDGQQRTEESYDPNETTPRYKAEWTYDSDGNCISKTVYFNNVLDYRILYTYDDKGNLLLEQGDTEAPIRTSPVEYTYDNYGNLLSLKKYTSSLNGDVREYITYRYNIRGQLLEEKEDSYIANGCMKTTTSWTYDLFGTMRTKTIVRITPDGGENTYFWRFNNDGRPTYCKWTDSKGEIHKYQYTYKTFWLPAAQAEEVRAQQDSLLSLLNLNAVA